MLRVVVPKNKSKMVIREDVIVISSVSQKPTCLKLISPQSDRDSCWRWYGSGSTAPLQRIRETGADGTMELESYYITQYSRASLVVGVRFPEDHKIEGEGGPKGWCCGWKELHGVD